MQTSYDNSPWLVIAVLGCPYCSYNPKYGMIYCKDHKRW
jgi:hypothetical protein